MGSLFDFCLCGNIPVDGNIHSDIRRPFFSHMVGHGIAVDAEIPSHLGIIRIAKLP